MGQAPPHASQARRGPSRVPHANRHADVDYAPPRSSCDGRGYLPTFQDGSTQDLIRSLLTAYCVNTGMK
jgi:hypothetical protein